jgi:hypothetical protein
MILNENDENSEVTFVSSCHSLRSSGHCSENLKNIQDEKMKNNIQSVLKKLSQYFTKLKQYDNFNQENIWTPRPFSPSRDNSHFSADPMKDFEIRNLRSRVLMNRHDHITKMLNTGNILTLSERFRSPSPPPKYDQDSGQRQNTREQRVREDLDKERRECMGEAARINSEIKIPTNFRPALKEVKLFIPQREHPSYSFVGLILGPRGITQKRLEAETGSKITIRGKGATKEGGQIRADARGRKPSGWNEDTHVHIAAESWDKIDAAIELVEPLLTYVDEEKNIHRRSQMLQLAKLNGTVKLDSFGNDSVGHLMLVQQSCGPLGPERTDLYRLPNQILKKVDEQYRRDVARVKGINLENSEETFQKFIEELAGN